MLLVVLQLTANIMIFLTSLTDPGIIPQRIWNFQKFAMPARYRLDELGENGKRQRASFLDTSNVHHPSIFKLKFCPTCQIFMPPRSHHCGACNSCVIMFDHHCFWLGTCIGKRNYRGFYMLLVTVLVLSASQLTFMGLYLWRKIVMAAETYSLSPSQAAKLEFGFGSDLEVKSDSKQAWACVIASLFTLVFACMVGLLCYYHTRLSMMNKTTYNYENLRSLAYGSTFSTGNSRANCSDRFNDAKLIPSRITRDLTMTDEQLKGRD